MIAGPRDASPALLGQVANLAAAHIGRRRLQAVAPRIDEAALADRLEAYDFAEPRDPVAVAEDLFDLLGSAGVRSDHPCYFGLFNPPALVAAIAGDLVTATVNPQLAVRSHAAAATDIEQRLVDLFARTVWPVASEVAGTFTGGGSEANHSAVLVALARRYPDWATDGVPAGRRPVIYVSSEAHLAWIKIARAVGLGERAVRLVPAADALSLSAATLRAAIEVDDGTEPLMLVSTAGTTAHGAIDDLRGIGMVARDLVVHYHVDAAWAGGALLDPSRRPMFDGIELADSVTIDPHKWLAVPMGAGLFLSRDGGGLAGAFGVSTGYMPKPGVADAYVRSMQWSRRFVGGKLFMALATLGLGGYREMIGRQFALGDRLRRGLAERGWRVLNDTALPLVCFVPRDGDDLLVRRLEEAVVGTGRAWISSVRLGGRQALRACVTGFETHEGDVDLLLDLLDAARRS